MNDPAPPLLDVRSLHVTFGTRIRAVRGISFQIRPGEILGLVGESGSGKSVTARSILQLHNPGAVQCRGEIHFAGHGDLLAKSEAQLQPLRGDRIAMILQDPMRSLNPAYPVGDQIAEVFRIHRRLPRREARRRSVSLLKQVGFPRPEIQARQFPHQFSGGMRQRAVIAMALACEPALLIADEPTTALDVTVQATILDLLRTLRDQTGTAILFITHDLGVVARLCDRVAVLYGGTLVETATVQDLFTRPAHPYTRALLRAVPVPGMTEPLRPIPGSPPDPAAPPPGCPFAPRCPLAEDICRTLPPLTPRSRPGHLAACWMEDPA